MNPQSDNEKIIIAYLLGELPEEELQRFERRYLKDDDLFQELNEIEDELIDDYVSGALSAERRAAFEKNFLRSSERRDKVEFAGAITERANLWKKTKAPTMISLESDADRDTSKTVAGTQTDAKVLPLKRRPSLPAWGQWAAIAAAALFGVVSLGLWLKLSRLQRELGSLREQQVALKQSESQSRNGAAELKTELSAEQQQSQALEDKVSQIEQLASLDTPSRIVYGIRVGIEYLTDGSKGEGARKTKTLEIPAKAQLVRLAVEFDKREFPTFKATLRRADRSTVWTRGGLKARGARTNQSVTLAIPAERLPAGDYDLVVSGVTADGNTESVGRYALKVVRK